MSMIWAQICNSWGAWWRCAGLARTETVAFVRSCLTTENKLHGKSAPLSPGVLLHSNAQLRALEKVVGLPVLSSVSWLGSLGDEGGLHDTASYELSTCVFPLSLSLNRIQPVLVRNLSFIVTKWQHCINSYHISYRMTKFRLGIVFVFCFSITECTSRHLNEHNVLHFILYKCI